MKREYASLLAARKESLRRELAGILAPGTEFVFEIGCGHGHFLTAYAALHPAQACVGLDLVSERIERARRKQVRSGLSHLHFLRGEARLFLEVVPPGARIATVFILFPDPWPKLRHQKHRILQSDFLSALAARASPSCRLYFRTDHRPYFEAAQAEICSHPGWVLLEESWPFEFATVFQQRAPSFASLVAGRSARCH